MPSDPYRSSSRKVSDAAETSANGDLLPALWCFWGITVVRLIAGIARHETFGTELTVALLVALFMPWLLRESFTRRRRPARLERSDR